MPKIFAVSLRGTKEEVAAQIDEKVEDSNANTALKNLMAAAPGNMASFQGSMTKDPTGTRGSINLNGSFWTKE